MTRRLVWLALAVIVVVAAFGVARATIDDVGDNVGLEHGPEWMSRAVYPLEHDAEIRAAAKKNKIDPALIAAVIYVESGFDETARSSQGAVGLMQVLPETAQDIARETGGTAFEEEDLENPSVNVRYGTYYLRSALDEFEGNTLAAVAAYNAGGGVVDEWQEAAESDGRELREEDIPYPETRAYVDDVLRLRKVYRETYGDRLSPQR